MSRMSAGIGALLSALLLAGCSGGGLDDVGQAQAGGSVSASPESTVPSPQPSPRMHQAVYCTSVVASQQVLLQAYMDLVERAMAAHSLATVSVDADQHITTLQQAMDGMPMSVVPMLQDELAVLMQVAAGEIPDMDRYRTAADGITTLCGQYQ